MENIYNSYFMIYGWNVFFILKISSLRIYVCYLCEKYKNIIREVVDDVEKLEVRINFKNYF